MSRPPKIGRRASEDERARAQGIVDLYRRAVANGGSIVVNPEDDPEEQSRFYATPESLLRDLERFAREGTFQVFEDVQPMLANAIARKAGPRFDDRVAAVAESLNVSERTAARLITPKRKRQG